MRLILRADEGCDVDLRDRVRIGLGPAAGLLTAVRVRVARAPDGAGHRCEVKARPRDGSRAHTVAVTDADPTEALVFAVRRLRARVLREVPRRRPRWGG